jgi:hypothetical protein
MVRSLLAAGAELDQSSVDGDISRMLSFARRFPLPTDEEVAAERRVIAKDATRCGASTCL